MFKLYVNLSCEGNFQKNLQVLNVLVEPFSILDYGRNYMSMIARTTPDALLVYKPANRVTNPKYFIHNGKNFQTMQPNANAKNRNIPEPTGLGTSSQAENGQMDDIPLDDSHPTPVRPAPHQPEKPEIAEKPRKITGRRISDYDKSDESSQTLLQSMTLKNFQS